MSRRAPDPIAAELTSYFLRGDSDQGLSSSWGPLAAVALGGFGGSPDPERRLEGRFRLGPAARAPITRAREVRAALLRIESRESLILFLAFGPIPWRQMLDKPPFGKGTGIEVEKRLGSLIGPAIFSETLDKITKHASGGKRAAALVALCLDAQHSAVKLDKVKADAARLLADAKQAYQAARSSVTARGFPQTGTVCIGGTEIAYRDATKKKPKATRATTGDRRRMAAESEGA